MKEPGLCLWPYSSLFVVYFIRPCCPVPHQVSEVSKSCSHQLWRWAHSSSHKGTNKDQLDQQCLMTLGHRCSDLFFIGELCVLTEHKSVFCCRSYRMEACIHLVMARGGNWVTAPPAMSFYPDECWSWWVRRCPRSPVAGTFCSKLGAQWFILDCT